MRPASRLDWQRFLPAVVEGELAPCVAPNLSFPCARPKREGPATAGPMCPPPTTAMRPVGGIKRAQRSAKVCDDRCACPRATARAGDEKPRLAAGGVDQAPDRRLQGQNR